MPYRSPLFGGEQIFVVFVALHPVGSFIEFNEPIFWKSLFRLKCYLDAQKESILKYLMNLYRTTASGLRG